MGAAFAPGFLRAEGVKRPPWPPLQRTHDLCDATLQALWWLRTHRAASPSTPLRATCPCCTRRFHTHGADPNCFMTMGQMTMAV